MWSNDPESYTSGNSAGGRISIAGQVTGDDATKKGLPWSIKFGIGASGRCYHHHNNSLLSSIIMEHTHTLARSLSIITYYTEHVYLCT
jgi:hypothetical protein